MVAAIRLDDMTLVAVTDSSLLRALVDDNALLCHERMQRGHPLFLRLGIIQ